MADTYSQTTTLGVLVTGKDPKDISKEKTVTIKVPNPRDDLQPSSFTGDIQGFFVQVATASGNLDSSDPNYDPEVTGAYREVKTSVSLDLTPTS